MIAAILIASLTEVSFTSLVRISEKDNGSYKYVEPSSVCRTGVMPYLAYKDCIMGSRLYDSSSAS